MNSQSPPGKPRREISRLIGASAFIFFYRLFGAVITFFTQVLLARWMGAVELGIYVLAFSWCILLSTISTGGFRVASIRFIGEGLTIAGPGYISGYIKRSRQISVIASLIIVMTGSLGLLAYNAVFGTEYLTVFIIALLAVPFFVMLNLYAGFANALSHFSLSFMPINVFRPSLFLATIVGIWLVGRSIDANSAITLNLFALAVVCVVTVLISRRILHQHTDGAEPQYATKKWIQTALPLLFVALFTGYFPELMVIMVGTYLPSDELAVFHVCFRVAMLIAFGLYAVDAFMGPQVTALLTEGRKEGLQQVVNRATRLRFWAALAAVVVLGLAGREVLGIFGDEFRQGYPILMILALSFLVQAGVGPVAHLISLSGHQNRSVVVFGVAIVVAIVLVMILVPLFGARGAAAATLLDTIFWVSWMRYIVVRQLGIRPSIF